MITDTFAELLQRQGMQLDLRQLAQFEVYYQELVKWNNHMNLTGIVEREQVYIKHFYDSLAVSFYVPFDQVDSVADIGSGAGFPSIPLKIVFPGLQVTIIESLNKRVKFLNHITEKLQLPYVNCVHGRAEDLAGRTDYRERFSLVTARAVARLNVLNEFCLPFVRVGGTFVAMKGADNEQERLEAAYSLRELRAEIANVYTFELPLEHAQRQLIMINKLANTPKIYPRKSGIPQKSPLLEPMFHVEQ